MFVVSLFALAACSDDTPEQAEEAEALPIAPVELGADEDIYALAEDFEPGEPGDVIAVQEVEGTGVDGTVLRVLYHSESIEGEDIAVSRIIVVPAGEAPAERSPGALVGARHHRARRHVRAEHRSHGAGIGLVAPFLERDMVFVATDYEGLGTPGRHPYIAGESEGRGTLDIVKAASS